MRSRLHPSSPQPLVDILSYNHFSPIKPNPLDFSRGQADDRRSRKHIEQVEATTHMRRRAQSESRHTYIRF